MFILKASGNEGHSGELVEAIGAKLKDLDVKIVEYKSRVWRIETECNKGELDEVFDVIAKRTNAIIKIEELQD